MILRGPYFPAHDENRMASEGDVEAARNRFFKERPSNLEFLLSTRYSWMNDYTADKDRVVEMGAGAGFSKEFITSKNLVLTDFNSSNDCNK